MIAPDLSAHTQTLAWQDLAAELAALVLPVTATQTVALQNASRRVLAQDVFGLSDLPELDEAVMDGYALGSNPPGVYRLAAHGSLLLQEDEAMVAAAGNRLPANTAAVVLARRARFESGFVHVAQTAERNNIRRAGEELASSMLVAKAGVMLDPRKLALLAAAGLRNVSVKAPARVALLGLPSGATQLPQLPLLQALLSCPALELTEAGTPEGTTSALITLARQQDLIVVTGASLGDETGPLLRDIQAAGGTAHVWRAALKPAKPLITGQIGKATIIGLGGTPYAVAAAAHLFLAPVLSQLIGMSGSAHALLPAVADFARARAPGRAEALPARMHIDGDRLRLAMVGRFGQLTALAALDGFALIRADMADIAPGDPVDFLMWRQSLLP